MFLKIVISIHRGYLPWCFNGTNRRSNQVGHQIVHLDTAQHKQRSFQIRNSVHDILDP